VISCSNTKHVKENTSPNCNVFASKHRLFQNTRAVCKVRDSPYYSESELYGDAVR
jgi:hypothetical protein